MSLAAQVGGFSRKQKLNALASIQIVLRSQPDVAPGLRLLIVVSDCGAMTRCHQCQCLKIPISELVSYRVHLLPIEFAGKKALIPKATPFLIGSLSAVNWQNRDVHGRLASALVFKADSAGGRPLHLSSVTPALSGPVSKTGDQWWRTSLGSASPQTYIIWSSASGIYLKPLGASRSLLSGFGSLRRAAEPRAS